MAEIEIREVRPSDSEALAGFYRELSADSLRARFLGYTEGISGPTARAFCSLDHVHDQGFVAFARDGDGPHIVGHLCLVRTGPRELELGVAVADGHQGRGIGRRLFEAALDWAEARHYRTITATCLAGNSRVLALLSSAPFGTECTASDAGVVEVTIPLQPPIEREIAYWPPGTRIKPRRIRRARSTRPIRVWRQPAL